VKAGVELGRVKLGRKNKEGGRGKSGGPGKRDKGKDLFNEGYLANRDSSEW